MTSADPVPAVSVLVVTYRCLAEAWACLASLEEHVRGVPFEVIVVDNASGDGTADALRSEFSRARVIALEENVGFARGVNRAAEEARGAYLLLLNPDSVVHEDAVERLVAFAVARPANGIYAGRNLNPDGTTFAGSVRALPSPWSLFCFGTLLSAALPGSSAFDPESMGRWRRDTVREVGSAIGSFLLVSREVWRDLGGFDPRFFMYGEDVDLSLRAARAGHRPVLVPDAAVTHELGASSASRPERMTLIFRGKATVIRKHWPPVQREFGLAMLWLGVALRAGLKALAGEDEGSSVWRGVWRARGSWLGGYPTVPGEPRSGAPD